MPAIGPHTEHLVTENGTGIRTAAGWTWICDLCHRTFVLGLPQDAGLDVQLLLDSLDALHWCELKEEGRKH